MQGVTRMDTAPETTEILVNLDETPLSTAQRKLMNFCCYNEVTGSRYVGLALFVLDAMSRGQPFFPPSQALLSRVFALSLPTAKKLWEALVRCPFVTITDDKWLIKDPVMVPQERVQNFAALANQVMTRTDEFEVLPQDLVFAKPTKNSKKNDAHEGASKQEPNHVPRKPTKQQRTKLTAEVREKICSSFDSMRAYLLFGRPGVLEPERTDLKPGSMNWRQFYATPSPNLEENEMGVNKWQVPHFAGYYWCLVSDFRERRNHPLTLPQYTRLFGDIKNYLQTTTPWRTVNYLTILVRNFDLLAVMAGKLYFSITLSDSIVMHPGLRDQCNTFMASTIAQRDEYRMQFRAGVEERELRLYGKNVYYVS